METPKVVVGKMAVVNDSVMKSGTPEVVLPGMTGTLTSVDRPRAPKGVIAKMAVAGNGDLRTGTPMGAV